MTARTLGLTGILAAAVFCYGCEEKGPAEEAGEKIDHAYSEAMEKAEDAGRKMEEAGEKIEEALEEAEEAAKGY
jgi:hypothetical protein